MNPLHISPNIPVHVKLVDPQGCYDFDTEKATYQTTCGQLLTLPREAVIKLNMLSVDANEEITITRVWSGKRNEASYWTVALSHQSEMARAKAEQPGELAELLAASIERVQEQKKPIAPAVAPTPIRKPAAPVAAPEQPKLFDRGTGTHGPAPRPDPIPAPVVIPQVQRVPALARRTAPIPVNVATREILEFVYSDVNTRNWSDEARQGLLSTILIAEYKQGRIGLWERGE